LGSPCKHEHPSFPSPHGVVWRVRLVGSLLYGLLTLNFFTLYFYFILVASPCPPIWFLAALLSLATCWAISPDSGRSRAHLVLSPPGSFPHRIGALPPPPPCFPMCLVLVTRSHIPFPHEYDLWIVLGRRHFRSLFSTSGAFFGVFFHLVGALPIIRLFRGVPPCFHLFPSTCSTSSVWFYTLVSAHTLFTFLPTVLQPEQSRSPGG